MDEKAVSCCGVCGGRVGNVAVYGIRPRHPIFFIIDRVVGRQRVALLSLPPPSCCVCAHAHLLNCRVLSCRVVV